MLVRQQVNAMLRLSMGACWYADLVKSGPCGLDIAPSSGWRDSSRGQEGRTATARLMTTVRLQAARVAAEADHRAVDEARLVLHSWCVVTVVLLCAAICELSSQCRSVRVRLPLCSTHCLRLQPHTHSLGAVERRYFVRWLPCPDPSCVHLSSSASSSSHVS